MTTITNQTAQLHKSDGLGYCLWVELMEIEKMITKKEDLINTYVKTDCEELVRLYLEKCKDFGFTWFSGKDIHSSKPNGSAVGLNEDIKLSVTDGSLDYFNDENCRELSLLDLKPRTKTEFVKCEFKHAWEALKAFEDGEELFRDKNQTLNTDAVEFVKAANVGGIGYILTFYKADNLYRKVEIEIDERQEFIDTYASLRHEFHGQRTYDDFSGFMYDSGKFKLVDSND